MDKLLRRYKINRRLPPLPDPPTGWMFNPFDSRSNDEEFISIAEFEKGCKSDMDVYDGLTKEQRDVRKKYG